MTRYLAVCLAALVPAAARAAITINITYQDVAQDTNVGFDDPVHGAARRAILETVTNYVRTSLNHNGTIDLRVQPSVTVSEGFLASAGPYFSSSNGFKNGAVFTHATTGVDSTGGALPDAELTLNLDYNWYAGTGTPAAGQFDLHSVLLHEVTHSLGIISLTADDGSTVLGTNFPGSPGPYTVFDSFLAVGTSGAAANKLFAAGGVFQEDHMGELTGENIYFHGPNAKAANGGQPLPVYSPALWEGGSSLGHLEAGVNSIMVSGIGPGQVRRTWTPLDAGILRDLGWNVVPEPLTATFALASVVVLLSRRRRCPV